MLKSPAGSRLKRLVDSNDLEWTAPLPPWADARDRQVRRLRRAARAIIRRRTLAQRGWFYLLVSSLAWPALAAVKAVLAPRPTAPSPNRVLEVLDVWWLQLAHNLRISEQHYFRFDLPGRRRRVRRYVTDGENKTLMEFLSRPARPERVRDKIPFAKFCAEHDLPTVPVLAECAGAGAPARWLASLPAGDLFLKPAALWGGQGACVLTHRATDGTWCADDGTSLTRENLAPYADRRLHGLAWLIQPRLRNGPAWAALSPSALCTVRVITGRCGPDAPVEIVGGFMRFPRERAVVDNLSSGGLGADYDSATGRLGAARMLGLNSPLFERHPDTGAPIAGTVIPEWTKVAALARRAHAPIGDIAMIGWDVALPGDEPLLIEANTNWGVPLDTPLGDTRYVEILLHPANAARLPS
jgi:Sugar-transfer associated ATP-grasp